ncbi:RHS repeat-associated core domain-containing protein [Pinirhizobacter soli]|uniref:RHS repeat-associated core domain-containing protein n=1 Tax=Pinirhizobacter soli TaxID=2786953 RepID=UPI00202A118F
MNSRKLLAILPACFAMAVSQWCVAGNVTYVYTDSQGTPIAEANSAGTITTTYDYKPFGSEVNSAPPDGVGFTGQISDASSGLVYMQARYYDPDTGRFLSTDPEAAKTGDITSFSRFAFADLNPVRFTDPNGQETSDEHDTHEKNNDALSPSADRKNPTRMPAMNVMAYVSAHLSDAQLESKRYGTSMIMILALGGLESTWGANRFALGGNAFYSMEIYPDKNGSYGGHDVMITGSGKKGVLKFKSFIDATEAFLHGKEDLRGLTDPEQIARVLQQKHHFAINMDSNKPEPKFVKDFVGTFHSVENAVSIIQGRKK